MERKKKVDQQNIVLTFSNTISHTSDKERSYACNSNDDNSLSDEFQSINVTIKSYHFV